MPHFLRNLERGTIFPGVPSTLWHRFKWTCSYRVLRINNKLTNTYQITLCTGNSCPTKQLLLKEYIQHLQQLCIYNYDRKYNITTDKCKQLYCIVRCMIKHDIVCFLYFILHSRNGSVHNCNMVNKFALCWCSMWICNWVSQILHVLSLALTCHLLFNTLEDQILPTHLQQYIFLCTVIVDKHL